MSNQKRRDAALFVLCALVLVILIAETAHALDPNHTYYLYEESQAPQSCLWHETLENHPVALTLSSVAQGCRVFHFSAAATLEATTSITNPKRTGWCVTAGSGRGNDGDLIQLVPCHGKANQVWHETENGQLRGMNGKCLVRGEGSQLVLGPCQRGIRWRPRVWTPD